MLVCNVGEVHVTAIINIGRMKRQARSEKTAFLKVSQVFLSETVGG